MAALQAGGWTMTVLSRRTCHLQAKQDRNKRHSEDLNDNNNNSTVHEEAYTYSLNAAAPRSGPDRHSPPQDADDDVAFHACG